MENSHSRRSFRLTNYDYSSEGAYFVTICTHHQKCLFGDVVGGEMKLNVLGQIVYDEWFRSETIRLEIKMDYFVVMPNHIHGIVMIKPNVGAHGRAPLRRNNMIPHRASKSLGSFVAGFKSICTKRINESCGTPGQSVWQRNYYEHVVRDELSLNKIRQYIVDNPITWETDEYRVSVGAIHELPLP